MLLLSCLISRTYRCDYALKHTADAPASCESRKLTNVLWYLGVHQDDVQVGALPVLPAQKERMMKIHI